MNTNNNNSKKINNKEKVWNNNKPNLNNFNPLIPPLIVLTLIYNKIKIINNKMRITITMQHCN